MLSKKLLEIGVRVYKMTPEELKARVLEIRKMMSDDQDVGMDIKLEALALTHRMIEEGMLDIEAKDSLDNEVDVFLNKKEIPIPNLDNRTS